MATDPVHDGKKDKTGLELDTYYMGRALQLAAKGLGKTRPNPAVGCVVLDSQGHVVGEGFHPCAGQPHAEVWALQEAGERARGGTAYVTLEPCNHYGRTPPCTGALLAAGVNRVVAAMVDPDPRVAGGGLRKLAEAGLEVVMGIEGQRCMQINMPFMHRIAYKTAYGVLHCSLEEPDSLGPMALRDPAHESALPVPTSHADFVMCDALVVEGCAGVQRADSFLADLAPTLVLFVVVATMGELKEVAHSAALRRPGTTVVVTGEAPTDGSVDRDNHASRSDTEEVVMATGCRALWLRTGGSVCEGLSNHLYSEGLLSAIWQVGPALATQALREGFIQKICFRGPPPGAEAEVVLHQAQEILARAAGAEPTVLIKPPQEASAIVSPAIQGSLVGLTTDRVNNAVEEQILELVFAEKHPPGQTKS